MALFKTCAVTCSSSSDELSEELSEDVSRDVDISFRGIASVCGRLAGFAAETGFAAGKGLGGTTGV